MSTTKTGIALCACRYFRATREKTLNTSNKGDAADPLALGNTNSKGLLHLRPDSITGSKVHPRASRTASITIAGVKFSSTLLGIFTYTTPLGSSKLFTARRIRLVFPVPCSPMTSEYPRDCSVGVIIFLTSSILVSRGIGLLRVSENIGPFSRVL